jgi:hypothetical protein
MGTSSSASWFMQTLNGRMILTEQTVAFVSGV